MTSLISVYDFLGQQLRKMVRSGEMNQQEAKLFYLDTIERGPLGKKLSEEIEVARQKLASQ